jgi:hypothetical protein
MSEDHNLVPARPIGNIYLSRGRTGKSDSDGDFRQLADAAKL